jgi:hypothetical protein
MTQDLPTKEEAWAAFWDVIAPALVQLHAEGKLPADDEVDPPPTL